MMDDIAEIGKALNAAGVSIAAGGIGEVTRLPGLTNNTWRVTVDGVDYVVRLPGAGTSAHIDRAAEAHNLRVAETIGVAAPVIHIDPSTGILVMRFRDDAVVPDDAHMKRPDVIARLGAVLRRLHEGPAFRGVMNPFDKIDHYLVTAGLAPDAELAFGSRWPSMLALAHVAAFDARALRPCHVDPVAANMLDTPDRLILIDWEYAAMSEPLWDLAYVAVEADFDNEQKAGLLAAYGAGDADDLTLWCAIAMAVTAAWCMMQRVLAPGEADFDAYATRRLADLDRILADPALRRCLDSSQGANARAAL
ncbi:MAG: choline kinase family protein [Pseudomonadota bacterium]